MDLSKECVFWDLGDKDYSAKEKCTWLRKYAQKNKAVLYRKIEGTKEYWAAKKELLPK